MKVVLLVVLLSLASCATRAPLSYNQKCGLKGMVLAGVNEESGDTSSYNYNTGRSRGSYEGESVQCVVPKDKKQECQAQIFRQAANPVLEYNDWAETKRFVNGVGYYAFVLPGVGMKLWFDSQRDAAVKQSFELEKEAIIGCAEDREIASGSN